MRMVTHLFACAFLLAICFGVSAQKSQSGTVLNHDSLIIGLGERFPSTRNVSKSDNFRVYEFKKDGIKYVQINKLDGTVLTAIAFTQRQAVVMPIGELASFQIVFSNRNDAQPLATAAATCPCSAQVVYEDEYARIVVVYGANGEVIQVITIQKTNEPK